MRRGSLTEAEMEAPDGGSSSRSPAMKTGQRDVVTEAVFDRIPVKEEVFKKLDEFMKPGALLLAPDSHQLIEQAFRFFHVGGGEALGEPAVDRGEQVAGRGPATLVAPQSGKARGGAQLPRLGFLLSGDAEGLAIPFLGGFGMALP